MGNKSSSTGSHNKNSNNNNASRNGSSSQGNIDFKITQMMNMGFDANISRVALEQCNGDLENAIAFILRQKRQEEMNKKTATAARRGGGNSTGYSSKKSATNGNLNNSTANREAMLAAAENRMTWRQTGKTGTKKKINSNNKRKNISPMKNNRDASTTGKNSNTVDLTSSKMGTTSSKKNDNKRNEKPIEKKLIKQAKILSANPIALDTCATIIKTIRDKPKEERYRKLRWSNKTFEKTIRWSPGATEFLVLIGFQKMEEHLYMPRVDIGLLYVASSILEDKKKSKIYQNKLKEIEFSRIMELLTIESHTVLNSSEIQTRKEYLDKCPAEPTVGEGEQTKITFVISKKRFTRRFPSDCSLVDTVINWLGSLNSVIPKKIISGDWILKNTTMFPSTDIDFNDSKNNTLYGLKLWPSGTVELAMSDNKA
jgi:hypothetical protein